MGDLSDFERERIVGVRLAGASVIKTATLLGVSRATVSKVTSAYTNHGKTRLPKKNSGRKLSLTKRDCSTLRRIVSINHRTTAAQVTAELIIPQKLSDLSFTNPTSTVGLQLLSF
jgi:transposase